MSSQSNAQEKRGGTSFSGIIRWAKEESEGMDAPEESMTTQKPKWDQAFPLAIHAVLEEFDDVFLQGLPLGLPPVREGHEFKIDLEDEAPSPSPIIQDEPARAGRGQETNREHARARLHQTIGFSLWCPSLVRAQKGWEPSVLHRLPLAEQENGQEQVSTPITKGTV